jgi:hypothetical protein
VIHQSAYLKEQVLLSSNFQALHMQGEINSWSLFTYRDIEASAKRNFALRSLPVQSSLFLKLQVLAEHQAPKQIFETIAF